MFIGVICAVLVGMDCLRTWNSRAQRIAEGEAETADLTRSLAQQAHDLLGTTDAILQGLRERVEVDGIAEPARLRLHAVMMNFVAQLPNVHGLFMFDETGRWQVASLADPNLDPSRNYADREYFQYHRTHADPTLHVSGPMRSKIDNDWMFVLSHRVNKPDGSFGGVVLATISLRTIQKMYGILDIGRHGTVVLETSDGVILCRYPDLASAIGRNTSKGQIFREFMPNHDRNSFVYRSSLDDTDRLGSFERVRDYPLVVVVGRDLVEYLRPWRSEARLHLEVIGVVALMVLMLGLRLAGQNRRREQTERLYRLLAENSRDAIICTGLDGKRRYVSPAFEAMTGWRAAEIVGTYWLHYVHEDDRAAAQDTLKQLRDGVGDVVLSYRYRCKDGSFRWVEASIRAMPSRDPAEATFVANVRDITQRKKLADELARANAELRQISLTDPLTGIANRRRLDAVLAKEWRRSQRTGDSLGLLMIDVDHFKQFNDAYGHAGGDTVLQAVARCLGSNVRRATDLAARYGGEEFAVVLPDTDATGVIDVAEAIRSAVVALGIAHPGSGYNVVTVSVGAACWSASDGNDLAGLMAAADHALYAAKAGGRDRVCLHALQAVPAGPTSLKTT